jgi:subtilisin family serine protease
VVQTNYSSFDGTSMATPHVAGVVALMKSANKALLPNQVKQILMGTASPLSPNGNNELGAGLVNAKLAVEAALRVQTQSLVPQIAM